MGFEEDRAAVVDATATEDDTTAGADTMVGGNHHRSPVALEDTVLVAVDITAANSKVAASIQAWVRSKEQQARLITYLNSKDTGLQVLELKVR